VKWQVVVGHGSGEIILRKVGTVVGSVGVGINQSNAALEAFPAKSVRCCGPGSARTQDHD
jgi:hypothetical protein